MDWAINRKVSHGGWCPKGRKAEDGQIPQHYNLQETTTANYLQRTEQNVIDSDGTLIVTIKSRLLGGSKRTAAFARKRGKPLLHLHPEVDRPGEILQTFIQVNAIAVLNVAGPRQSREPFIAEFVMAMLDAAQEY